MDDVTIVDDPDRHRLVGRAGEDLTDDEGRPVELEYRRSGDRLLILHTRVPDALGGRGLGGRLVAAAVDLARGEGLTVVPHCPYARSWIDDHPDEVDGVSVEAPPERGGDGSSR